MQNYSSENTALLIVDPFNDFLSEGGKLWSFTKETVKGVNLIENLKKILSEARASGIKVVYVPHRNYEKGDFEDWNFLAPTHAGSLKLHSIDHVVIAGMKANTCIDTTARYAVELGYHTTLIKDAIAAFTWEEIKATVEVNFLISSTVGGLSSECLFPFLIPFEMSFQLTRMPFMSQKSLTGL